MFLHAYNLVFTELALLAEAFSKRSRRFNETRFEKKQGRKVNVRRSRYEKNAQRVEIYSLKAKTTPYEVKTRRSHEKNASYFEGARLLLVRFNVKNAAIFIENPQRLQS